jgi:hypothetical protein
MRLSRENENSAGIKKQKLRLLMECFGATENALRVGNLLKEMGGTRRLELLTSTVSKPLTQKELITEGAGRTVILGAICYQIATETGKWVRG